VYGQGWEFTDIFDVVPDVDGCTVTFKTHAFGIFSVIQRMGLYIAGCGPFYMSNGYTNSTPILKAYITDATDPSNPVNGVDPSSIVATLNGITIFSGTCFAEGWGNADDLGFDGSSYFDVVSGLFAVKADYNNQQVLTDGETNTFTVTARNVVGDVVTCSSEFMVDTTKPVVDWTAGFIGPDFCIEFTITDAEAGVDPRSVFLDLYTVVRETQDTVCCYDEEFHGTELKEYRMQLTPDALEFTEGEGGVLTVRACDIAMDLAHGEMLEVVLYSERDCCGCEFDYDDVPDFHYAYGAFDLVYDGICGADSGNCLNIGQSVTRRYMVDAMAPTAELLSLMSDETVQIRLSDCGGDIDPSTITIKVDGDDVDEYTYENGVLTFDIPSGGRSVVVTVEDSVGNVTSFSFTTQGKVLTLTEAENDPNPFDPEIDGVTDIEGSLSKPAHVTVKVYDFAGNYVATLAEDVMMTNSLEGVSWAGTDDDGKNVANGVYFCYIEADDGSKVTTEVVKIVVLRGVLR